MAAIAAGAHAGNSATTRFAVYMAITALIQMLPSTATRTVQHRAPLWPVTQTARSMASILGTGIATALPTTWSVAGTEATAANVLASHCIIFHATVFIASIPPPLPSAPQKHLSRTRATTTTGLSQVPQRAHRAPTRIPTIRAAQRQGMMTNVRSPCG